LTYMPVFSIILRLLTRQRIVILPKILLDCQVREANCPNDIYCFNVENQSSGFEPFIFTLRIAAGDGLCADSPSAPIRFRIICLKSDAAPRRNRPPDSQIFQSG